MVGRFSAAPFVPNDLKLDAERRMLIVTGPNMGGKSTYMRQAALIALLAHVGSYVPAEHAILGPWIASSRASARAMIWPGALDLHGGDDRGRQHPAQRQRAQLILLDEIGRGTSTFDGLSLAWAMARDIATWVRSFTLRITSSSRRLRLVEGCANVHLDATEHGEGIVFLHAVKDGPPIAATGCRWRSSPACRRRSSRTRGVTWRP